MNYFLKHYKNLKTKKIKKQNKTPITYIILRSLVTLIHNIVIGYWLDSAII